jgi:RNA polymerase sigma-70 factor (ECF subfamily)
MGASGAVVSQAASNVLFSFPTTHWSLIAGAGTNGSDATTRQALQELLRRYLPALRSHLILRKRIESNRSDDILQAFLTDKVLTRRLLHKADRAKGRFRTFLLTALDRYAANQLAADRAKKRSDAQISELAVEPAVSDGRSPTREFEIAWARQVINQAIAQFRRECEASGRSDLWGLFEARLLMPLLNGAESPGYEELVERFGFASPSQASNALVTAKRGFVRAVRAVIGQYERNEQDIDNEINDLFTILTGSQRSAND